MNILVVAKSKEAISAIQSCLKEEGYTVYGTTSTLGALEMIKAAPLEAVLCGHHIQIVDVLDFPRWISSETGRLPPYFILSEELQEEDILQHKNARMVAGFFKTLEEVRGLKGILECRQLH